MKLIFDASSLLNLAHGGVLQLIVSLASPALIGPQVYHECKSIRADIDDLVSKGTLQLADDSVLPAELFFELLGRFGLGDGETECIAFAKHDATITAVCCDDRRARNACGQEVGAGRVTGTIGRLANAVKAKALAEDEAYSAYQKMLMAGAFLPALSKEEFAKLCANLA